MMRSTLAPWLAVLPPLMLLIWLGLSWRRRRRRPAEPQARPTAEPPSGLAASEVGTLISASMDPRDLAAGVFDLAVRGVIAIHPVGPLGCDRPDHLLVLNEQAPDGVRLESFEEALIEGLFGGKNQVLLSSLHRAFQEQRRRIERRVLQSLAVKGLLRARSEVARTWIVLTLLALALAAALGYLAGAPWYFWIALAACAPPMLALAPRVPQRTAAGLAGLVEIAGLEQYLLSAGKERQEPTALHRAERLLPFAVALDLGDSWADAFADCYEREPPWYGGHAGGWSPGMLAPVVAGLARSVERHLSSVPRTREASLRSTPEERVG
jgi:hypothetical protein